jgi:hypothetical protein
MASDNMGNFYKLALPIAIGGIFFTTVVPGLLKLVPLVVVGGVIWATYHVAKGFDDADRRR